MSDIKATNRFNVLWWLGFCAPKNEYMTAHEIFTGLQTPWWRWLHFYVDLRLNEAEDLVESRMIFKDGRFHRGYRCKNE